MALAALVVAVVALCLAIHLLIVHRPVALKSLPVASKMRTLGDPWSSLGPNTGTLSVGTGAAMKTIPAYYMREQITLSIDTGAANAVVYGLCGSGTPSATNFHFALFADQPPFKTQYTGPIQLVAGSGTVAVGVLEGQGG